MTKEESLTIKGVAILLMLYLHLFDNLEIVNEKCITFISVGNIPIVYYLSRLTRPVSLYLILSGYGLYSVYKKGDNHRYSRIFRLLEHYWIVLLIFVVLGIFLRPNDVPGSWTKLFRNILAVDSGYSNVWWFLFPYLLLSFFSKYIFKICDRYNARYVLIFLFILNLATSFGISRYGEQYLFRNMWLYKPYLFFHLLFPFVLGAYSSKYDVFNKFPSFNNRYIILFVLLLLMSFRCCFATGAFHAFYLMAFVFLVLRLWHFPIIDNTLKLLGKHSMNMWLIHPIFCYHFFVDWTYSFRYPIIILFVLILESLLCSIITNKIVFVINHICSKIVCYIKNEK